MNQMNDIERSLKQFSEQLRIENYSLRTVKSYLSGLRQFLVFRERQKIREPINQEQARQFILYKYDRGAKWSSINIIYSSLRKYFIEVEKLVWSTEMIKRPRAEKVLPELLSTLEVKRIIESCTMYKYQVIISLLYSTGLRISECQKLEISQIDGERKQLLIKRGKGNKDRYVDLPEKMLLLLREYYDRERPKKYLFNGQSKGDYLSLNSIRWGIKRAVNRAKILKKVSAHTFRNCYATHHLEAGTNIVYLQHQMGHSQLKTTARYIRLSQAYTHRIVHPIDQLGINYLTKSRRSDYYLGITEKNTLEDIDPV